jgi:hypothetical protein
MKSILSIVFAILLCITYTYAQTGNVPPVITSVVGIPNGLRISFTAPQYADAGAVISSYRVYIGDSFQFAAFRSANYPDVPSTDPFEVTGLVAGTNYSVRIRAQEYWTGDILNSANAFGVPLPAEIVGDPQFSGLRGQQYQVHGIPGNVYSIISDVDLQYNSRFVFLDDGKCPIINGVKDTNCWTHPGTYLQELGLETIAGDRLHIVAGSAENGFGKVALNDKQISMGECVTLNDDPGYICVNTTHKVSVQMGNFRFVFTNSDQFINQQVAMINGRLQTSHGLLGQTWSVRPKHTNHGDDVLHRHNGHGVISFLEGAIEDYSTADGELFSNQFVFNRFKVIPDGEVVANDKPVMAKN